MANTFSIMPDRAAKDHHIFLRMIIVAAVAAAIFGGIYVWSKLYPSPAAPGPARAKRSSGISRDKQILAQQAVAAALAGNRTAPSTAQLKTVASALAKASAAASTNDPSSRAAQEQRVAAALQGR